MARIAVVKPYPEYAKMIAALLREAGYEVLIETPPIDWERLLCFEPDVLIGGLFRMRAAFNRPIANFKHDVLGHTILEEFLDYPAIMTLPLMLLGNALEETDLPYHLNYDAFLIFPDEMPQFLGKLAELSGTVKSRSRIAPYACPRCEQRMTYYRSTRDLFCPRCHTSAAIIDDQLTVTQTDEGTISEVATADLEPPSPQPPKPGL